jgi:uncharacterized protein (DUF302 family)
MNTEIKISHQRMALKSKFGNFIAALETVLNRLNTDWSSGLQDDPEGVKEHLTKVAGDTGLMIFGQQEHGKLLAVKGKQGEAIQYIIGNPLTAVEMTQHDIRAALYAPLRVIFYVGKDQVLYAEYDLPSSLFGQFGNNEILKVSKDLDKKLSDVILLTDQKAVRQE